MRISRNILIYAIATTTYGIIAASASGDALSLFRAAGISKIEGTIASNSKLNLTPQQREEELQKARKALEGPSGIPKDNPIARDSVEGMLSSFEKTLMQGQHTKEPFTLLIGKNTALLHTKKNVGKSEVNEYELETATTLYIYNEFNKTISILPGARNPTSKIGTLTRAFGGLGQFDRDLSESKFKTIADGNTTYKSEDSLITVAFENAKRQFLKSKKISYPDGSVATFTFQDYQRCQNTEIPRLITFSLTSDTFDKEMIIQSNGFSEAMERNGELSLPLFGYVTVDDQRFDVPLSYEAYEKLPSDVLVTEFLSNSDALTKYNQEIRSRVP